MTVLFRITSGELVCYGCIDEDEDLILGYEYEGPCDRCDRCGVELPPGSGPCSLVKAAQRAREEEV